MKKVGSYIKKVVIPVLYVLTHFIVSIMVFYTTIFSLGYTAKDITKIAIFSIIFCTAVAAIFGYRYGELIKGKISEIILSACIIGVLFFASTLFDVNIFGKWLTFKNLFSYSGVFWVGFGQNVDIFNCMIYILYYLVIFYIGVWVCRRVNKSKIMSINE